MKYYELNEELMALFLVLSELGYVEMQSMVFPGAYPSEYRRAGLFSTEPETQRLLKLILMEVDAMRPAASAEAALDDFDVGDTAVTLFSRLKAHVQSLQPRRKAA